MPSQSISKSKYLRGLQCHKSLWLLQEGKIKKTPPSKSLQLIFDEGTRVGKEAQKLFPGGKLIKYEGSTFDEKIAKTKEWLASGESTIYEATFEFDDILVMVDILTKGKNGWEFYEVKSAAKVYENNSIKIKDVYINDLAIQYYVLKGSGLNIASSFLVHINNQYVRQGLLEIEKLFAIVDLTKDVLGKQIEVAGQLKVMRDVLCADEPKINIGAHCDKPYECDFKLHCWPNEILNGYSVFDISGLAGSKKFKLYESGITKVEDVPETFPLPVNQRLQVETELSGKEIIDFEQINNFLKDLYYPLYFLDFETFTQTVPEWDDLRPYQKIPFQYSIHYIDREGECATHLEFLADENSDPRKSIADRLVRHIPKGACVIVYNCSFEKGVLQDLAKQFPDYSDHLMDIHDNIMDLMVPFQKKHYYKKEMKGRYSIKAVLPALTSGSPYSKISINEGMEASNNYKNLTSIKDSLARDEIRENLKAYCKQDTQSMVDVLECLKKVSLRSN
tara:strand:+ start:259 stop:1773 length:1515 start_codon:yes stop_codon:yes gene_type:complete